MLNRPFSLVVLASSLCVACTAHAATRPLRWLESAPPARTSACAVYDSASDRLLLFGGSLGRDQPTWYRLPAWEFSLPSGSWRMLDVPSLEYATERTCAFDPVRRRYWQFGWYPGDHALRIDLAADGAYETIAVRGARPDHPWELIAFDARHDRFLVLARPFFPLSRDTLVLYAAPLADTLVFRQIPIRGEPRTRYGVAGVVWDPGEEAFIAVASRSGDSLTVLSLSTGGDPHWEEIPVQPDPAAGVPPSLSYPSLVHDPASAALHLMGVAIQGGRFFTEAWKLERDPIARWSKLTASPDSVWGGILVADSRRRRLILHGGFIANGIPVATIRDYDIASGQWELREPAVSPEPRADYAIAYDHPRDRLLLYGGSSSRAPFLGELWSRDSRAGGWEQITPNGTPPAPRSGAFLVEDERHDRFLLVGGWQGTPLPPEVWQLTMETPPTWSPLATNGTPPDAVDGVLFDDVRDRLVVHGAVAQPLQTGEWELSLREPATWRRLPVAGDASPPRLCGFALDRARDRALLFGGYADPYNPMIGFDALWGFSLASDTVRWEKLSNANETIRQRFGSYMNPGSVTVDPVRDRLVSFGGYGTTMIDWAASDLATAVSLSGLPVWTDFDAEFGGPPPSYPHAMAYDPLRDSFVLFGIGDRTLSSTTFEWQGLREGWPAVEARVTSPYPPAVRLAWSAPSGPADAVVKRRRDDGAWRTIGTARRAADGMLHFTDSMALAGTTASYRLSWPAANGEIPVGEITLTTGVPTVSAVRIRENPARASIAMDLDLPLTGPVWVELLDLAGRRLREQAFELSTPGRHPFQFTNLGGVPPGLYFVRVTSPAGVHNARVSLLR